MYKHIFIATSLAVGLISQTSVAKPVDRLEEKRPNLATHLKADARQHPVAYRQIREDALNNPGKTRKLANAASDHPVATTYVYKKAKANPDEAVTIYGDAKKNKESVVRAYRKASANPGKARQLRTISDKKQKYRKVKSNAS